ncbi:MAG: hypothetical protein C0501_08770, partial [Isosphaera sp.]|nr:hypothetical protein [Isosphaera sp.]
PAAAVSIAGMNRLARRKFLLLFVTLLGVVVGYPLLRTAADARLLIDLLISAIFLAALRVVFTDAKLRAAAVLLGVPALGGMWAAYLVPGAPRLSESVVLHLCAAVSFGFTIGAVLRGVFREDGVTVDDVYGAFCGYLLLGLLFGHLYAAVELVRPGSFQGAGMSAPARDDHHFLLTYFSFLTLTTVGYGDVVPAADAARGLVVAEAVAGQFYLAGLIAEVIGRRVGQARRKADP